MTLTLSMCHICNRPLQKHPLHSETVAKTCFEHGDFFIQQNNGQEPTIVFRPFDDEDFIASDLVVEASETPDSVVDAVTREFHPGNPGRIVRCDQTGEIFYSVQEAGEKLGIPKRGISNHIHGRIRHIKGYTFTRLDNLYGDWPDFVPQPRLSNERHIPSIALQCDQTGEIFESIRSTAKSLGLTYNRLLAHLKNPQEYPTVKGYSFTKMG